MKSFVYLISLLFFCQLICGEELVVDGGGEKGTLLFDKCKIVETKPFAGAQCLEMTGTPAVGTQLIPVDAQKNYAFTGAFRTAGEARVSVGFQCFDKNKTLISCHNVKNVPGSLTSVVEDAHKGTTTLLLADASRWNLQAGRIVAFGAKEDFSDLPNRKYHYPISNVTQEGKAWKVEFTKPLPWDVAAGTNVRLHCDGSYMLTVGYRMIPTEWQRWNDRIMGQNSENSSYNCFWPGTAYVKLFFYLHQGSLPVYLDEISLAPIEAGQGFASMEFYGNELLSQWSYRGGNAIRNEQGMTGTLNYNCGFVYRCPEWDADDVKQIEVDLASFGQPGHLTLTFTATKDGKDFMGSMTRNLHPDGKVHTTIFPVDENPDWQGTVKELFLRSAGWDSPRCLLQEVRVLPHSNKIPKASAIRPNEPVYIRDMMPRAEYRLAWKGAKNPSGKLELLDRRMNVVSTVQLDKNESRFAAGEEVVLARYVQNGGGEGFPILEKTSWKRNHYENEYWKSSWIWCQRENGPEYTYVWFEKSFELEDEPEAAVLATAVDDVSTLYINGKCIGKSWPYYVGFRYNIAERLKKGRNVIRLLAYNWTSMGGVLCEGYIRLRNGREIWLKSDATWTMAVGSEEMPEKIDTPVVVLGDARKTEPWHGRAGYRYTGPQGKATVLKATPDGFDVRLDRPLPKSVERLRFVARTASGREFPIKLALMPSQNQWKVGETTHVRWNNKLAQLKDDYTLYLDDDYLACNKEPVAFVQKVEGAPPALSKCEVIDAQTRPKLRINGKVENPFFWSPGNHFAAMPDKAFFEPGQAMAANARMISLIVRAYDCWKGPDEFDFTDLEKQVFVLLTENPGAYIFLNGYLYLPKWWLNQHPDSIGRRYDGSPMPPTYDSALSSEEWLEGASYFIAKLVDYVKNQPWADRVVGFCSSESPNSEWFWETNCEAKPNGRSVADYKAFRSFLRAKYGIDANLRNAWKSVDVSLDDAPMPSYEEMHASQFGSLLDPATQQKLIDWFDYRGKALAKSIITFSKAIKEQTNGCWMTQAYYGYYVMFATTNARPPQFAGHNGFLEVARSPYVDAVRAPSQYARRKLGDSDGIMQPQDSFLLRKKLVYIEEDNRTYLTPDEREYIYGRYDKPFESLADNLRCFGMMLASGVSRYILEFNDWYCDHALLEGLAAQQKAFMSLPPVKGTTPKEMAIVGSRETIHYTRPNKQDTIVNGASLYLNRYVNRMAMPYRQLVVEDLLEEGLVPPHKFYIMTAPVVLSKEERAKLRRVSAGRRPRSFGCMQREPPTQVKLPAPKPAAISSALRWRWTTATNALKCCMERKIKSGAIPRLAPPGSTLALVSTKFWARIKRDVRCWWKSKLTVRFTISPRNWPCRLS